MRLSSKGQIVIPKEVRRRRNLDGNTELLLHGEGGGVLVLRKKSDVDRRLKVEFDPLLQASERSLAEL